MHCVTDKPRKAGLYIASAMIPFAILTAALWILKAVPFGDNTMLLRDAGIQYIDFVSYLRTILAGENDLFYSFSKNLGGEMLSLLSYYLVSPFNLLFAFASDEGLTLVFTLVMVLKLSACGLTFFHASAKLYGCRPVQLAFSTAYALMAYNVIYGWSIMWLDGVLILPLLALGLYELWRGGKPWRYVVCLAYGLLTNFYIGYMLCISSVLFSLVHMLLMAGSVRQKFTRFGRFLAASLVGGLGSAFLWLPAFLPLLEGRAQAASSAQGGFFSFQVVGLAGKLVAGASSPVQLGSGTPHIFCGTLVLLLVLAFLMSKNIDGKKRLAAFGVLAVIMVSFILRPINIMWHGFSPNYAFNFRYAFIFNYVMIMVAQYALGKLPELGKKPLLISGGLILVLILALLGVKNLLALDFVTTVGCLVSLAALLVVLAALAGRKTVRLVCPVLILVGLLEMGANCVLSWDALLGEPDAEMLAQSEYEEFHSSVAPAVAYVKALDDGFYRMEKTFLRDINDSMNFDYHGVSHFSSSQQKHVLGLLEKLGLRNYMNIWSYYNTGSTAATDALLGIKYVLSRDDLTGAKGYELLTTEGDIGVYRNPNTLPVAMLADSDVLNVDMEQPSYFLLQNQIWSGISGSREQIMLPVDQYEVTLKNVSPVDMGDGSTRYIRQDMEKPASVCFEIPVTRELPLYFYFTSDENQDAEVYINGKDNGAYFCDMRWDMTNAGVYAPGETVRIELRLTWDQLLLRDAWFFYEDLDALRTHTEAILAARTTVQEERSSCLTGSFLAEEGQLLLFTIPHDTGWQLWVDGIRTDYVQVLDALFAAEVPEGSHSFELRYMPRGLTAGCCLSAGAALAAIVWWLYERKRKENIHG